MEKEQFSDIVGGDLIIDEAMLDKKISDLTVREFMKVLFAVIVKKKTAYLSKSSKVEAKIIEVLMKYPQGLTVWDIAKNIDERYSLTRYHINKMGSRLETKKMFDPFKRIEITNVRLL